MANETGEIVLSMRDLRGVAGYAAQSAQEALEIFERAHPADSRPATRSTPHGRSPEVVSAGRHCATPRGRRTRRLETRTRGRGRCGASSDARHPLRTCIH